MSKLSVAIRGAETAMKKHSPEILTGIGITVMVTATVLAVRATPKALTLIEERKYELETDTLTPVEVVKTTWSCYIPALYMGIISVLCLLSANTIQLRRNAALSAAYHISNGMLKEYRAQVVKMFGKRKDQTIRDDIARGQIEKKPVNVHQVIVTGRGMTLAYDTISGRYFFSDIEKLRKAQNRLNHRMVTETPHCISLNDFYDEIGLPPIFIGYDLGWNREDHNIEMVFSSQLTEDGTPCLVVAFQAAPEYCYT